MESDWNRPRPFQVSYIGCCMWPWPRSAVAIVGASYRVAFHWQWYLGQNETEIYKIRSAGVTSVFHCISPKPFQKCFTSIISLKLNLYTIAKTVSISQVIFIPMTHWSWSFYCVVWQAIYDNIDHNVCLI
jgi:hypothetical protein